jgi:cytochrome P450
VDLFVDDVLSDPYPHYRALRDLAPVVYLRRHDVYAISRYEQVRVALGDWRKFSSANGVGLNDVVNTALTGTLVSSDPPLHTHLRRVLSDRLTPRGLADLEAAVAAKVRARIKQLVATGTFDAVADLARPLPAAIVLELLGFPAHDRDRLLTGGHALFNAGGPLNARTQEHLPAGADLVDWLAVTAAPGKFLPGSLASTIFDAAEAGELEAAQAISLITSYTVPALDTTISAIGSVLWLMALHPDQWRLVCRNRALIPSAFNEALRLETPVQMFTRTTTDAYSVEGMELASGTRVVVLFASANRDERHYPDPDTFDVMRRGGDNVAFGYGIHGCPGQALARMQAHAILNAFADANVTFEMNGEPTRELSNVVRGLSALPISTRPNGR